jgi:ABC-type branched-subunit amino acid transport system substrate-binding protein
MKSILNHYLVISVLAIALIPYSGCRKDSNPVVIIEPLTIGVILPLDQEKGVLRENAMRTAVNIINASGGVGEGRMIELVVRSSEGVNREETAVAAAREIIKSKSNLVGFISSFSSCSKGLVEQVAIPNGYPVISGAATAGFLSGISPYFQRLCPPDAYEAIVLTNKAKEYGFDNIAIAVEEGDVYSSDLANAFQNEFGNGASVKVLFSSADPDYSVKLDQLLSGNPDAVFLSMLNPVVYEEFLAKMNELNENDRFSNISFILSDAFYTTSVFNSPIAMMVGELNGHPKNFGAITAADTNTSPYKYFEAELNKQFDQEVASYNAQFFDIIYIYALAIEKTLIDTGTDDMKAFREKLQYWIRQVSNGADFDPAVMPSLGWKSLKEACKNGGVDYVGASGNCDLDGFGNAITPYAVFNIAGDQGSYYFETISMVFPE